MNRKNDKLVAGYMPVIHQGYLDILSRHRESEVGIFDTSIISQFNYLRKDIRALENEAVVRLLAGLGHRAVSLSRDDLSARIAARQELILFDDDVSRTLAAELDPEHATIRFESPFLRWDRRNAAVNTEVIPDRIVSGLQHIVAPLFEEAEKSTDWWRQVAAGIIDNDSLILSHNRALPGEYTNFIEGDPRITSGRGTDIDRSLFIHAEADLIAHMANQGISTHQKDIYVTTFPCPNCAKLIAAAGIKTCYFVEGYATLDGQRVMKDAGVEIVQVRQDVPHITDESRWRTYPDKSNG